MELDIECRACGATGLYKGMAERGACAVVCCDCKGTGKKTIHVKEFKGRKKRDDIKRVFGGSYGYAHTDKDTVAEEGGTLHFSRFGCTYEDWLKGAKPKPMEELYCPYIYDNQGIGNEPFLECADEHMWSCSITDCTHYKDKHKCWERWNRGEAYKHKKEG